MTSGGSSGFSPSGGLKVELRFHLSSPDSSRFSLLCKRSMRRRARASAEGRSPPAAVDGWQLTVTKRAGARAPLVEPAQKLLAVGPTDQISAAAHKCC